MGKWKLNATVLVLLIGLSACGQFAELEEVIESQDEEIFAQNELIASLEHELEAQVQLSFDFESEIEDLQAEVESLNQDVEDLMEEIENAQIDRPEWQSMLAYDLMENIEELTVGFLGGDPNIWREENVFFFGQFSFNSARQGYVVAQVDQGIGTVADVIFSFEISDLLHFDDDSNWEELDIYWEVVSYVVRGGYRPYEERVPRHLTDLDIVTIRIYEYDWGLGVGRIDMGWVYEEMAIQGSDLWEETRRLMPEIRDLWYEGSTLYVDLMPSEFIGTGASGDSIRIRRLQLTFASFPHASEIRFSTGGHPGFLFSTGPPGAMIFNVAEGRPAHVCELAVDDPWAIWANGDRSECE